MTQENKLDTRIQLNKVKPQIVFPWRTLRIRKSHNCLKKKKAKILKPHPSLLSSVHNPALPYDTTAKEPVLFSHHCKLEGKKDVCLVLGNGLALKKHLTHIC